MLDRKLFERFIQAAGQACFGQSDSAETGDILIMAATDPDKIMAVLVKRGAPDELTTAIKALFTTEKRLFGAIGRVSAIAPRGYIPADCWLIAAAALGGINYMVAGPRRPDQPDWVPVIPDQWSDEIQFLEREDCMSLQRALEGGELRQLTETEALMLDRIYNISGN